MAHYDCYEKCKWRHAIDGKQYLGFLPAMRSYRVPWQLVCAPLVADNHDSSCRGYKHHKENLVHLRYSAKGERYHRQRMEVLCRNVANVPVCPRPGYVRYVLQCREYRQYAAKDNSL